VSGVKKSRAAYFFQKHVRVFCRLSRGKPRIGDYVFRAKMTWESGSAEYSVLYGFTQSIADIPAWIIRPNSSKCISCTSRKSDNKSGMQIAEPHFGSDGKVRQIDINF
jgi:hypothetical protein